MLVLMGPVDAEAVLKLEQAMISMIDDDGYGNLILDMSGVQSMDEAVYAALLDGHQRCRKRGGGGLGIACPIRSFYDEFENRGLNKLFTIRASRQDVSQELEPAT